MKESHKFQNCSVLHLVNSLILALRVCIHEHMQVCLTRGKYAMYLGGNHPGPRSSCAQARSLDSDQDKRLRVEMLQHSSMLPGRSQQPCLSLHVCVDTH